MPHYCYYCNVSSLGSVSESLIGFDVASKAFYEMRDPGEAFLFCLLPHLEAIKKRGEMNAVEEGSLDWKQKTWVLDPALHITSCVTLGKSLLHSEP